MCIFSISFVLFYKKKLNFNDFFSIETKNYNIKTSTFYTLDTNQCHKRVILSLHCQLLWKKIAAQDNSVSLLEKYAIIITYFLRIISPNI